ncbi:MAG: helix-turn-helix transcriptional regulator [Actinomycetota bacterium]|jgi:DNA-binding XRE family transcriptional regulator|nr:helix-turn-helix transcriptional regulator [Actinomycetota bacterium]
MKKWDEITADRRADPGYRERVDAEKRRALGEIHEFNLAELRRILQFTQEELAGRMGTDQSRISRVENEVDMRLSTLRAYVEALGGQIKILAEIPGQEAFPLSV